MDNILIIIFLCFIFGEQLKTNEEIFFSTMFRIFGTILAILSLIGKI
jgi:hypothetical protein